MSLAFAVFREKSRLRSLLDHFSVIDDPREPWRVAHPLGEVLLLVVCASMADCDHYDAIAAWGEANLAFLRRYLPYEHGAPGGRWLTLLMNRINPALFSAAFTAWVRETWPDRPDLIAIDGKTSRRSHDRGDGKAPLHLVSAFATTSRLVLGQEAVEGKTNELAAIPVLLDRLAEGGSLKGALVSIDAIATNARIAQAIKDKGADYLLAVKANQPTLRKEMESAFAAATGVETFIDHDKGHGRIERRTVSVIKDVDWLDGERRFPGELRLPHAATLVRVQSRAELSDRSRFETRCYVSSAHLSARRAEHAVRGHWGIENQLHWTLDVVFADDQSACEKVTAQETWPSSGTSRSTSSAPPPSPKDPGLSSRNARPPSRDEPASGCAEKSPDGPATISPKLSDQSRVNPDSEPCFGWPFGEAFTSSTRPCRHARRFQSSHVP